MQERVDDMIDMPPSTSIFRSLLKLTNSGFCSLIGYFHSLYASSLKYGRTVRRKKRTHQFTLFRYGYNMNIKIADDVDVTSFELVLPSKKRYN